MVARLAASWPAPTEPAHDTIVSAMALWLFARCPRLMVGKSGHAARHALILTATSAAGAGGHRPVGLRHDTVRGDRGSDRSPSSARSGRMTFDPLTGFMVG